MSLEGVLQNILQVIVKDPVGLALQTSTVICSLLTAWLLSRKGLERWGYLIGFLTLPLWCITEAFYQQWVYFSLNPIYFYLWGVGLKNHWGKNEEPAS